MQYLDLEVFLAVPVEVGLQCFVKVLFLAEMTQVSTQALLFVQRGPNIAPSCYEICYEVNYASRHQT
jgi:hypothetical protein